MDAPEPVIAYRRALEEAGGDPDEVDPLVEEGAYLAVVADAQRTCPEWCRMRHRQRVDIRRADGFYEHARPVDTVSGMTVTLVQARHVVDGFAGPVVVRIGPAPGGGAHDLLPDEAADLAEVIARALALLAATAGGSDGAPVRPD